MPAPETSTIVKTTDSIRKNELKSLNLVELPKVDNTIEIFKPAYIKGAIKYHPKFNRLINELENNTSIESLKVDSKELDIESLKRIFTTLENSNVNSLDLSSTDLTGAGTKSKSNDNLEYATALTKFLANKEKAHNEDLNIPAITEIDFRGTFASAEFIKTIVKDNPSIRQIHYTVGENFLENGGINANEAAFFNEILEDRSKAAVGEIDDVKIISRTASKEKIKEAGESSEIPASEVTASENIIPSASAEAPKSSGKLESFANRIRNFSPLRGSGNSR